MLIRGVVPRLLTTSLKTTEQKSADGELNPIVDEAHSKDASTPGNDQEAHPYSSANSSDEVVGWQLKDGITDEEDEER